MCGVWKSKGSRGLAIVVLARLFKAAKPSSMSNYVKHLCDQELLVVWAITRVPQHLGIAVCCLWSRVKDLALALGCCDEATACCSRCGDQMDKCVMDASATDVRVSGRLRNAEGARTVSVRFIFNKINYQWGHQPINCIEYCIGSVAISIRRLTWVSMSICSGRSEPCGSAPSNFARTRSTMGKSLNPRFTSAGSRVHSSS